MSLLRSASTLALGTLLLLPASARAQDFTFNVNYFGGGVNTLGPGSDPVVGTSLDVGDRFVLDIAAQNGFWNVTTSGRFFPFMAMQVNSGTRTGTYTLDLFRNGANVFTLSETSSQSFVHLGTNTVNLLAGLEFDVMRLDYTLDESNATTIFEAPVFAWPETQQFFEGRIEYVVAAVPEPSALLLLGVGVAGLAARRRRTRQVQGA